MKRQLHLMSKDANKKFNKNCMYMKQRTYFHSSSPSQRQLKSFTAYALQYGRGLYLLFVFYVHMFVCISVCYSLLFVNLKWKDMYMYWGQEPYFGREYYGYCNRRRRVYNHKVLNCYCNEIFKFEPIWPSADSQIKLSEFGLKLLKQCESVQKPEYQEVDIKEFKKKSSNFPLAFGTNTCRVLSQPKDRYPQIQKQIASAYPVIHERVLQLYLDFLEHKCKYGNAKEKEIYEHLNLTSFLQRLLSKRCASFFGKNDKFLLLSRERGNSGFVDVGSYNEKPPLILKNVLSYDEIKLSALLSVSSYSELINDGHRKNCGVIEKDKSIIERQGVVMGIIGARLTRRNVMEFQDIIISKTQNTKDNGYGYPIQEDTTSSKTKDYRRIWKEFYEEPDFLFTEINQQILRNRFDRFERKDDIFDNIIMKKRYAISFDTLLLEAEARAKAEAKQAYVHVVGIGLGVWKATSKQEHIFLQTFSERVKYLLPKLQNVGILHFSWFTTESGDLRNGKVFTSATHPKGGIKCIISKRNPADKLKLDNKEMLLVISYAWDGNALPGNEFWMKMLKSTGDSSTACSTLITELHNPHINDKWVKGDNLHVATEKYGVIHIAEYVKNLEI